MPRILIVSYHFWDTTAEGLATAKLAGALTERGHQVALITSRAGAGWAATDLAPRIALYEAGADVAGLPRWWRALEARSARSWFWSKAAALPNILYGCRLNEWAWVRAATRTALWICDREGLPDILHTRLNHYLSHLAGLEIVRSLPDLPWCAYFSDPWPFHRYPEPYRFGAGPLARRRQEQLLDAMLARAGSYVLPSERLRRYMIAGRRARFDARAFVAPHLANTWGARPAERPREANAPMIIRHAGFLMKERRVEPLYDGLRLFLAARPEARARLRIEFAGRYHAATLPIAPADLAGVVRYQGYLPPEEAWAWLGQANVCLLVEAHMREGIFFPSKLADYLGARRPILALSPGDGVTADYLRAGGGVLAGPDDPAGIAAALAHLYDRWLAGSIHELRPTEAQARSVMPESVIPIYEQAFSRAVSALSSGNGGSQRGAAPSETPPPIWERGEPEGGRPL